MINHVPCTIRLLKVPEGSLDFYEFDEYDALVHGRGKWSPPSNTVRCALALMRAAAHRH